MASSTRFWNRNAHYFLVGCRRLGRSLRSPPSFVCRTPIAELFFLTSVYDRRLPTVVQATLQVNQHYLSQIILLDPSLDLQDPHSVRRLRATLLYPPRKILTALEERPIL